MKFLDRLFLPQNAADPLEAVPKQQLSEGGAVVLNDLTDVTHTDPMEQPVSGIHALAYDYGVEEWTERLVSSHPHLHAQYAEWDHQHPGLVLGLAERSTVQSIPSGVATAITFDSAVQLQGFTLSSGALVAEEAGWYVVSVGLRWANGAGIRRGISVSKNVSVFVGADNSYATDDTRHQVVAPPVQLAVGDTIEATAFQDSGGSLNIRSSPSTFLSVYRVASV